MREIKFVKEIVKVPMMNIISIVVLMSNNTFAMKECTALVVLSTVPNRNIFVWVNMSHYHIDTVACNAKLDSKLYSQDMLLLSN